MANIKTLLSAVLLATSFTGALSVTVLRPRAAVAGGHGNCFGLEQWRSGLNYSETAQVVYAPDRDHNHQYSAKASVSSKISPDKDPEHWNHLGVCK
jgi:hypothetical protein